MIDIQEKKKKILEFLNHHGPSLPVQVARTIQMDPVFASAILSELLGTKEIKISHMKIGASPLYLIPGQEEKLEEKSDNLKPIEKEAQEKLKSKKVISDEDEEPATRVALRNIKDFAVPFKFQDKITWKYAFTPQEEIDEILSPKKERKESFKNYFIYKFTGQNENGINKNIEELESKYGNGFTYYNIETKGESRENIITKFKDKIKEFSKTNPEMKFIVDYKYGLGRLMKMELEEARKYGFKIIELNKEDSQEEEPEVPKAWEVKKTEIKQAKEESTMTSNDSGKKEQPKKVENIFENPNTTKTFLKEIEQFLKNQDTTITAIEEVDKNKVIAIVKSKEVPSMLFAFNRIRIDETELLKCYKEAEKKDLPYQIIIKGSLTKKLSNTILAHQKLLKISKL